ncbi:hypothetical protein N9963_00030 [Crocinitomicaceae bacterium]|nr:hypothetical protein [Crocinitomicaceae bacterium]|tara:strand:- start:309 stop:794 length:486 start_codon:yes stop_codon:yes gene_type:complete
MQNKFSWKKGLFSSLYKIYSNGQQIGILKDKMFSQTSNGEINGEKYTFKTKGIFKQHTEIIDNQEEKVIGQISYNNWMTKATISIFDKTFIWKYENIWNTKWSVIDSEGNSINYSGDSTSGKIESTLEDDLLLLTGLFVTNYFWQITIVIIFIIFIPMWNF